MKWLLTFALLAMPLAAQVEVGMDAPEIAPRNWINPPAWGSLEELRGDVVIIKAWGKN